MTTLKREMRLKVSEVLKKYNIDDLGLEMDLIDAVYEYAERKPERKPIMQAVADGFMENDSISNDCIRYLNYSPNWNTRDNSALMSLLKARKKVGQDIKTFSEWYWRNHWKGQKGQPPTSKDIQENWYAAFGNAPTQNPPSGLVDYSALRMAAEAAR